MGVTSVMSKVLLICLLVFAVIAVQAQVGISPGVSGGAPVFGGNVIGPVFNCKNQASACKGDAKSIIDGVTSNGSATVTSATAGFTQADVGKLFWCVKPANGTFSTSLTTIASVNSASSIIITAAANTNAGSAQNCVWGTQDDTSVLLSTYTAAANSATYQNATQHVTGAHTTQVGTMYVPAGGYIVSGPIYNFNNAGAPNGYSIAPNLVGEGRWQTTFYLAPTYSLNNAPLINLLNGGGFKMEGFAIEGELGLFTGSAGTSGLVTLNDALSCKFQDVEADDIGFTTTASAVLYVVSTRGCKFDNVFIQQGPPADASWAAYFSSSDQILISNSLFSNHQENLRINASAARDALHQPFTLLNDFIDECALNGNPCTQVLTSTVTFLGTTFMGGNGSYPLQVTSGSIAYLTDVNVGNFNSTNNNAAIQVDAGGTAYVSTSTVRGNGTSVAVTNNGTYVDTGGNIYQNCNLNVCTAVTAATYATLGFGGSTVPKSSLTHTPNTCYAVTGNLLATAQNLCVLLLDQNYQILNITAQSGGTTPTNSSCATPPVITLSDGTRTATLTMTTGKTTWSSSVDSVTNLNQIFASGTSLTVSIGANTCATPPTNVSVNYVLQSILNP
jgi:hypothetical protein